MVTENNENKRKLDQFRGIISRATSFLSKVDWSDIIWHSRQDNYNYAFILYQEIIEGRLLDYRGQVRVLTQEELDDLLHYGCTYFNFDLVEQLLKNPKVDVYCRKNIFYHRGFGSPLISLLDLDVAPGELYNGASIVGLMVQMARLLLEDGRIDVNTTDKYGETALIKCWSFDKNKEDKLELIKLLVEFGADPDFQIQRVSDCADGTPFHNYGDTPIIRALRQGDYENATYLLTTGKIRHIQFETMNLLHFAIRHYLSLNIPPYHKHTWDDSERVLAFLKEFAKHVDMKNLVLQTFKIEYYDDGDIKEREVTALELAQDRSEFRHNTSIVVDYLSQFVE